MARLSNIIADASKQANGVWLEFEADVELLIGSAFRQEFKAYVKKTMRELTSQRRAQNKPKKVPESELRIAIIPGVVKYLLLGWRNIEEEDGKTPMQYTEERAAELLAREDLEHVYDFVITKSKERGIFMQRELDEDLGN